MVEFNLWGESFIFFLIFSMIMIIPCVFVALMGRKMIDRLGQYPTKTPIIQMSIFFPFVATVAITFFFLIGFYHMFEGK